MTQSNWKQDAEYRSLIEDLIERDEVQQLQSITQHRFSTRLEHSLSVSYTSYKIAKRFDLNCSAIARAGLLHDFFHEDRKMFKENYEGYSHAAKHPKIALENAKAITSLTDVECDIIVKHMWLSAPGCMKLPKYKESYVVTMVDKYCATKEAISPLPHLVNQKDKQSVKTVWSRLKPITI